MNLFLGTLTNIFTLFIEITCQVAISFLQTLPISPPDKNSLLTTTTTTTTTTTSTTTTTIFPFIDTNLIKKTNDISYNGNHKIKWKKDGKDLPKDIKINLRFAYSFYSLYFLWPHIFVLLNDNFFSFFYSINLYSFLVVLVSIP